MSKVIVQTTGQFSLYHPEGAQVHARRPTVATLDNFLQQQINVNKATILMTGISNEATDAEFEKFWIEADGDVELALESFRSSFPAPKDGDKTKTARKPKDTTK